MNPICRASDPIESFQAADQAADLIKTHERLIVSVLTEHGDLGVDGIAARCNVPGHAIGKRMCKLLGEGRVELTGRAVKSDAGRAQREWRAV